jgi:lectin, mannose-binding 2
MIIVCISFAVQVDPKNSGEWADCVTIANTGLEPNWLVESHIGFTGTTGQLADNHDILSLEAFSDDDVMHLAEMNRTSKRHFNSGAGMPIEDRLHRLEEAMNTLLEKMEYNEHHLEHELVSIDDHLKSMVGKLEKKEDESESRIEVIEQVKSFNFDLHLSIVSNYTYFRSLKRSLENRQMKKLGKRKRVYRSCSTGR